MRQKAMSSASEEPRRGVRLRVAASRPLSVGLVGKRPKRAPKAAGGAGAMNVGGAAGPGGVKYKRKRGAAVPKKLPPEAAEFLEPLFAANNNKLAWPKPKERLALAGTFDWVG